MGCDNSSLCSTAAGEKVFESVKIPLTSNERYLIRKTWKMIENKQVDVGKELFVRFFKEHPSYQSLFPEFRGLDANDVKDSRALYGHARRVMKAVENAVASMDDVQIFAAYLLELGRRHNSRSLTETHLVHMRDAFLDAMHKHLSSNWSRGTRTAWTKLFSFMADKMMQGYRK